MRRPILALVLGAALLALGAPAGQARAAELCVGGKPARCFATIQAALAAAHDGDTIRLGPGTFPGGIAIAVSVTLDGAGADRTIISGGGPVVTIGSATATPTVTISNLTITGGATTSNPQSPGCGPDVPTCSPGYADATALGGGVEAFPGTTVTIASSVVAGNSAAPAISTMSVKATCPGGPCPASFGDAAGIDNWGTMTLDHTTVADNHAAAVQSNGGGIVDESDATLALRDSTVTGNTASAVAPSGRFASGGGIFVDGGGTLTVDHSQVDGNGVSLANSIPHPFPEQGGNADQSNALGGGVLVSDGATATFRQSTLDGNSVTVDAPLGEPFGADAALCACGDAPIVLDHAEVAGNTTTVNVLSSADAGPSGPAALEADSDAVIGNSRITGNSIAVTSPSGDAAALGAVAFFFGGSTAPTIDHSTIGGNTASATSPNGAASVQGAGLVNNGPLVLDHVSIVDNAGTATGLSGFAQGGGIWNGLLFGGPTSPLALRHTDVTGNTLTASPGLSVEGGGLFTDGFPATLDHSRIEGNAPDECFGC